ncbi:hypothetical protein K458DRAFT_417387 [Lentithecium fluviatile CBS 122367]|uniref:HRDC domain-containing protein n=1 Tax=Lentithecium fluviatile CBS 122367 TaxID=1168545 RepID=A0A6G1J482_9PLEO|nr:hypothetical protein K458DRAFT_417387 [Lentithecium fluviatile CBS 122367]
MSEQDPPGQDEVNNEQDQGISWPLSYRMQISQGLACPRYWCHDLYRGPNNALVEVLYSKDKARSEILAKKFLGEAIVGFDMEWPWNSERRHRLQDKIGLIQVASEDKIALFHIGLHPGKTTDDIIAPSLKQLIESPTIAKTGVAILNADFARLKKYFGLKPQGAFELSHLHRLVKFGTKPEMLTTKLVKLAYLVEEHLGLPLFKGEVRTSNWSRPLNKEQIRYAASDAYAGVMLFHRMNAKRAALNPVPPLPVFAEKYRKAFTDLLLHQVAGGTDVITAKAFFKPEEENVVGEEAKGGNEDPEAPPAARKFAKKEKLDASKEAINGITDSGTRPVAKVDIKMKKERVGKVTKPVVSLDPISKRLFAQLATRRRVLAEEEGLPLFCVATNAVLEGMARRRPERDEELLEVKGIGKRLRDKYGAEWLEVIAQFLAANEQRTHVVLPETSAIEDCQRTQLATPRLEARRRRLESQKSPDSSLTFGTPVQPMRQLHTGLSFTFAETQLNDEEAVAGLPASPAPLKSSPVHLESLANAILDTTTGTKGSLSAQKSDSDTDGSSVFTTPPSRRQSHLKRKREAALPDPRPASLEFVPAPFSPRSKIFRNKLLAFSRFVTKKLPSRAPDAGPIVSESTLDSIVTISPQTQEALHLIPGIETFARACKEADMDLLRNIIKFAPARF